MLDNSADCATIRVSQMHCEAASAQGATTLTVVSYSTKLRSIPAERLHIDLAAGKSGTQMLPRSNRSAEVRAEFDSPSQRPLPPLRSTRLMDQLRGAHSLSSLQPANRAGVCSLVPSFRALAWIAPSG
jgi:hypothetical protein